MRLVDGNHVVQQFATTVTDPTLGDPVLPRTADRRLHRLDVHRANRSGHFGTILGIMVEDDLVAGS